MKCCSLGLRLTALICLWTMIFMTGCGAGRNRNDVTDSIAASTVTRTEESDTVVDITTEAEMTSGTDSGTGQAEESDTDVDITTEAEMTSGTDPGTGQAGQESDADPVRQEGELITDAATLQAVLDIAQSSADQTVVEYADFTAEEFLAEVAAVYQMAHDNGYVYGDSQTMPPCEDGFISCDRLIARALWNLGMTDQPAKGMNVGNEVLYLTTHGFELVTDQSRLEPGDIVMQDNGVSGIPNWRWHTFVLVSYDPETTMCEKYDCGHFTPEGKDRISSEQPFVCPLADYGSQRRFVCGFHLKQKPEE